MCVINRPFKWPSVSWVCLVLGLLIAMAPVSALAKKDIQQNVGVVSGDPTDGLGFMDDGGGGGGIDSEASETKVFTPETGCPVMPVPLWAGNLELMFVPIGHFPPITHLGCRQILFPTDIWVPREVPNP